MGVPPTASTATAPATAAPFDAAATATPATTLAPGTAAYQVSKAARGSVDMGALVMEEWWVEVESPASHMVTAVDDGGDA